MSRNLVFLSLFLLGHASALTGSRAAFSLRGRAQVSHRAHAPVLIGTDPLQELPTPTLLKAIAKCGSTGTAADVAAAAGLDLAETRRQLLVLARLVGAELQVSEDGELLFVFDEPGALKRSLRVSSARQRVNDAWTTVSPPLFWLMRASFGLSLIASLTLVTAAIAALSASSKDDSSSRSSSLNVAYLWGPSPLDFLYYSTRPYYYGYSEEKGFLQSCFSLLFGDGDPNADLAQRTSASAASLIRANGGAVTAEQLAPLLAPSIDPERADEDARRPGAPVSEDWMLPILLQFNGEPVVTDDGDLVYVFPELMATADGEGAAGAQQQQQQPSLPSGAGALLARPAYTSLREQVAYGERPPAWRPVVGERVIVERIKETRVRNDRACEGFIGVEGRVVADGRDYLPLGVSFDGQARPNAYFAVDELLPAGDDDTGVALRELPQPFSTAPPSKLMLAGGLGVANLFAVLYLGRILASVAGYPAAAFGQSAPLISLLRKLYVPLLVYASGFIGVPVVRAFLNRRKNRAIEARNVMRARWGRALGRAAAQDAVEPSARGGAIDVVSEGGGGEGGGLRARLARKLQAARRLRPRLRRIKKDAAGQYSSASDLATVAGESGEQAELLGSGFDDFDARLAARPNEERGQAGKDRE
jgi:hypothetical protein